MKSSIKENTNNTYKSQKGSVLAWTLVVALLILLLVTEGALFYLLGRHNYFNINKKNELVTTTITPNPTPTPTVTPETTKKSINKQYSFPLINSNNDAISEIIYSLEEYEVTGEIIVKGQRANAVSGRAFLMITLEITNRYDRDIEIDARDYIRLSVNNEDKWSAPDIYYGPVEIQASSTKNTRVGFPIKESDTSLRLQIGEPEGEKDIIFLN
jgi:hypothetical protein